MQNIVLFGGTFDPPHIGHLLMAQLALEQTRSDAVWFLPAPAPPHKLNEEHTRHETRVRLVQALVEGYQAFKVCDIERSLPTPSYTVDTIHALSTMYPNHHFQFLCGSDSLANLPHWHRANELVQMIEFVVAVRTGYPFEETLTEVQRELPALRATVLEMPIVDVSSTFLRERLRRNLPICGLIPPAVLQVWLECGTT
ncbi:nicotinate (nicotinamide) nucleotide adenylyltransferase [Alicyclobacillus pomorum]|jgi:nicotinate-nucleotide adenylyltransferase